MKSEVIRKIKTMPDVPGVYIFRGKNHKVIYIGKAVSLKKRLQSYLPGRAKSIKTQKMVEDARSLEVIVRKSEEDALLLENNLIKEQRPKYNIALRDDKTYPFVCVSQQKGAIRVYITRRKREQAAYYFGPFTNVKILRLALKGLRYVFPYASCRNFRKRGCIYAHINLCPAPCIKKSSSGEDKHLLDILKVMSGDSEVVVQSLLSRMAGLAKGLNFEQAGRFRDMALAVSSVFNKNTENVIPGLASVFDLKDRLGLNRLPRRIEGIDISNLQGTYSVGSLVCFKDGAAYKPGYRRYKIKTVSSIDDYAMIEEVVRRRCGRISEGGKAGTDMFLIDGGKGQVSAAYSVVKKFALDIEVVGLAKEEEIIFVNDKKFGLKLPAHSSALRLLQAIRDEAHRFAQKYHHCLKKKGDFS